MTTKEALAMLKRELHELGGIPEMSEEEAQRLMSKPSASFIRRKKPESDEKESPQEKKKE